METMDRLDWDVGGIDDPDDIGGDESIEAE